jgi:CHASE2 domain-containing sensor protein
MTGQRFAKARSLVLLVMASGLIAALCATLCFLHLPWLQQLELDIVQARLQSQAAADVVVVAITPETFEKYDVPATGVIPRRNHARLLKGLDHSGAAAVAFDLKFGEPSREHEDDRLFSDALSRPGVPVTLVTKDFFARADEQFPGGFMYSFSAPFVQPKTSQRRIAIAHALAWGPSGQWRGALLLQQGYPHIAFSAFCQKSGIDHKGGHCKSWLADLARRC